MKDNNLISLVIRSSSTSYLGRLIWNYVRELNNATVPKNKYFNTMKSKKYHQLVNLKMIARMNLWHLLHYKLTHHSPIYNWNVETVSQVILKSSSADHIITIEFIIQHYLEYYYNNYNNPMNKHEVISSLVDQNILKMACKSASIVNTKWIIQFLYPNGMTESEFICAAMNTVSGFKSDQINNSNHQKRFKLLEYLDECYKEKYDNRSLWSIPAIFSSTLLRTTNPVLIEYMVLQKGVKMVPVSSLIVGCHYELARYVLQQRGDVNKEKLLVFDNGDALNTYIDPIFRDLIYRGYDDVIRYMGDLKPTCLSKLPKNAINIAARLKQFSVVKLLHSYYPDTLATTDAMDLAARCSLEMVQFLYENRKEGFTKLAYEKACEAGQYQVLLYLNDKRSINNLELFYKYKLNVSANKGKNKDCIQFINTCIFNHNQ